MARSTRGRARPAQEFWPGFVDALATLLIVIIFLLMVFVLAQFFLGQAISGRDEALRQLGAQVTSLSEQLSQEKTTTAELRARLSGLAAELEQAQTARDTAQSLLVSVSGERDRLTRQIDDVNARLATAAGEVQRLTRELADARDALGVALAARGQETTDIAKDIDALRQQRNELDSRLAAAQAALRERDTSLTQAREQRRDLETRLAQAEERQAAMTRDMAQREIRLGELQARGEATAAELERERAQGRETQKLLEQSLDQGRRLAAEIARLSQAATEQRQFVDDRQKLTADLLQERRLSAEAQAQVELLNQQIAILRAQLDRLARALDAADTRTRDQEAQITDLGRRLNLALVSKVEELARYRSEFFGKLRDVLGDRPDVRVVGDRFVFQSEVLFAPAAAELPPHGKAQVARIAGALKEIAAQIPADVPWVLQVNGHTDATPIRSDRYPSNWELSQARALSVVRMLIEQGIEPRRLVAAGWGEHQPLDPVDTLDSRQRNRRIELKLTER